MVKITGFKNKMPLHTRKQEFRLQIILRKFHYNEITKSHRLELQKQKVRYDNQIMLSSMFKILKGKTTVN
jgi:hypothetical protein